MGSIKLSTLISIFLIGSIYYAKAQVSSCGTQLNSWIVNYDLNHPGSSARTSLPNANKVFSVYAYICLDINEQPVTTAADIQDLLDDLAPAYAPIGFTFKLCETISIPDYRYRDIEDTIGARELLSLYYHPGVINIYFGQNAIAGGNVVGGYASFPGGPDQIVVGDQALQGPGVLIHEMGHFFGLYHTFEDRFGPEFANGSNCTAAGDLLCDTGADPFPNIQFDSTTCEHQLPVFDLQGNRYAPPYDNYMSYLPCACRFTQDQYQRMYDMYTTARNYLK